MEFVCWCETYLSLLFLYSLSSDPLFSILAHIPLRTIEGDFHVPNETILPNDTSRF